jgi:hypothetical protein
VKGSLGVATFERAAQLYVTEKIKKVQKIIVHNAKESTVGEVELQSVGNVLGTGDTARSNDDDDDDDDDHKGGKDGKDGKNEVDAEQDIPVTFAGKLWALFKLFKLPSRKEVPPKAALRGRSATGRKLRGSGMLECRGFMEVLSVATEYLSQNSTSRSEFKPRSYSTWLLWAVYLIVPVYQTYWIIDLWVYLDSCRRHHHYGFHSGVHGCDVINFRALYTLGFTLQWLSTVLGIINLAVSFSVLMYSADVANALSKYWLHRFHVLRRISGRQLDQDKEKDKESETSALLAKHQADDTTSKVPLETIQPLIERDAYERYLFTHTYFAEASNQWSLYLFLCLAITFGLCLEAYLTVIYLYAKYLYVDVNYTVVCALNALVFTLVFACMAYANSAVEKVRDGFLYAGTNDYALIGGREAWLEYVEKAPIYWYIFGFAIKRSDVISYVGGIVSAAVAGVVMSIIVSDT